MSVYVCIYIYIVSRFWLHLCSCTLQCPPPPQLRNAKLLVLAIWPWMSWAMQRNIWLPVQRLQCSTGSFGQYRYIDHGWSKSPWPCRSPTLSSCDCPRSRRWWGRRTWWAFGGTLTSIGFAVLHLGSYARVAARVLVSMCQQMFKGTCFMLQGTSLWQS